MADCDHIGMIQDRQKARTGARPVVMRRNGMSDTKSGLQLRTLLKKSGELELSLVDVPTPEPADDEVVVRVEATPINPSDLGLLIGPADMSTVVVSGSKESPVITAKMPDAGV